MLKKLPIHLLALASLTAYAAETTAPSGGTAEVSGVFGSAFVNSGTADTPVRTGTRLAAGTTIRTESGAAMDVYLGREAGVIRLTQNTTVRIEKLADTNSQSETYLHLQRGTILGNSGRHASGSARHASDHVSGQIKTAVGIAEIGSAAFRLHAEGYLVVLNGTAHFAHVPATGEPKLHTLNAPPPVYFSPTEGVKPAPKELVREVVNQSKARLGQELQDRSPSAVRAK